jgi:hypothetical protein
MVGGAERREDGWTSAHDVREDGRRGRRKERRGQDKSNQKKTQPTATGMGAEEDGTWWGGYIRRHEDEGKIC